MTTTASGQGMVNILRLCGIPLRDALQWHTIAPTGQGEMHGIPCLRGHLIAKNGDLAIMLRCDTHEPVLVHAPWFVPDARVDRDVDYMTTHEAKPRGGRKTVSSETTQELLAKYQL